MITKQKKIDSVAEIKKCLKEYPVVAIATAQNLPAKQLGTTRKKLKGKARFISARNTIVKRAIEESGRKDAKELERDLKGRSAIIVFSTENPFKLFARIKKTRTKTFAKPGMVAQNDINVSAGETNLTPGPVLTELKKVGLQAQIQGPKITIKKDMAIVKKGETVGLEQASVLAKLEIKPIEQGMEIISALENGTVYPASVLSVDEEEFLEKLAKAFSNALNLCVEAGIMNKHSIEPMIARAVREAKNLAPAKE